MAAHITLSKLGKRRLMSEYKQMQKKSPTGIAATPFAGRLNIWQACIFGPDETLWEGGTFFLRYVSSFISDISHNTKLFLSPKYRQKKHRPRITGSNSLRSIRTSHRSSSFRPRCFIPIFTRMEKYV